MVSSAFLGILLSRCLGVLVVGIWLIGVSRGLVGDIVSSLAHIPLGIIGRIMKLLLLMLVGFLILLQVIAKLVQVSVCVNSC